MESTQNRDALTQSVKKSLKKAEEIISGRKKTNTGLLVAAMTTSAASTLVAGITAAQGPVIGTGIEGWRVACIIAAVFGFASTVSTGLSQQLKVNDRVAEGNQCASKLRSLDVGITTGSRNWEEIVKEYEEIAKSYPEFIS
jgi:ABC-type uncharacterized transport system substrate-binding protein